MSKTAKGLVDYCKAQLGKPYWWGTFGQTATAVLYIQKKDQYPGYYTAADFPAQYGQRVHDCVGLIKGYRWSDTPTSAPGYSAAQDVAVSGLYIQCSKRGSMGSMPDIPGVCLFMADMGHVGVYIGNGQVIEARGHAYGVMQTALQGRGWAYWGMPSWIDYSDAGAVDTATDTAAIQATPTVEYSVKLGLLKYGMACEQVRTVQRLLIALGYSCGPDGADGDMGVNTVAAVKDFQTANGLLSDGEVGGDTWARLIKG